MLHLAIREPNPLIKLCRSVFKVKNPKWDMANDHIWYNSDVTGIRTYLYKRYFTVWWRHQLSEADATPMLTVKTFNCKNKEWQVKQNAQLFLLMMWLHHFLLHL
jgi:hypothetical protein